MKNQKNKWEDLKKKFSIKKKQLAFASFVIFLNFFTKKKVQALKSPGLPENKNSKGFFSIENYFDDFKLLTSEEHEEEFKKMSRSNFMKKKDLNYLSNLFRFRLKKKLLSNPKIFNEKKKSKIFFYEMDSQSFPKKSIKNLGNKLINKKFPEGEKSVNLNNKNEFIQKKTEEVFLKILTTQNYFSEFYLEQFEKFIEKFQFKLELIFFSKKKKYCNETKKYTLKNWKNKEIDFWRILYFSFKKIKNKTKRYQKKNSKTNSYQNNSEIFNRNSKKLKKMNIARYMPLNFEIFAPDWNMLRSEIVVNIQSYKLFSKFKRDCEERNIPKKNTKLRKKILNELKKIENIKRILKELKKKANENKKEINMKKKIRRFKSKLFNGFKVEFHKAYKKKYKILKKEKKNFKKTIGYRRIKKSFYRINKQTKHKKKYFEKKKFENLIIYSMKSNFKKKKKMKNLSMFWQNVFVSLSNSKIERQFEKIENYKIEKNLKNIDQFSFKNKAIIKIKKKKKFLKEKIKPQKKLKKKKIQVQKNIKKFSPSKKHKKFEEGKKYKNEISLLVKKKPKKMMGGNKKKILSGNFRKRKRIFKLKPKKETKKIRNKIFRKLNRSLKYEKAEPILFKKNIQAKKKFKKMQASLVKKEFQQKVKKEKAYSSIDKKSQGKNKTGKTKNKKNLRKSRYIQNFHPFFLNENISEGEKTRSKKIKTNLGQTILGGITIIETKEFSEKVKFLIKKNLKNEPSRMIAQKNIKCLQSLNNLFSNSPDSKASLSLILGTKEIRKWNGLNGIVLFDPSRGFLTEIFSKNSGSVFLKYFPKYKKTTDYDSSASIINKIKIFEKKKSFIFRKKSKNQRRIKRVPEKQQPEKNRFKRHDKKIKFEICFSPLKKKKNYSYFLSNKKTIFQKFNNSEKFFFVSKNYIQNKYYIFENLIDSIDFFNFEEHEKEYNTINDDENNFLWKKSKKFKSTLYKIKKKSNKNKKVKKKIFTVQRWKRYKKKMIRFIKKIKPRKRFINKKFLKPQSDPNDLFDLDIMTYPEMEDWDLFLIWEHSPEEWDEISTIKNKGTFKNRSNLLFQWKKDPKNTVKTFYENFSRHFSTGVVGLISHISLNDFIECSLRSKSTFQSTNYLENTRKLILKNFTQSIPKFIFRNKSKKILKHFSKKELRNDKKNTRKNIKKISKHYSLLDLFDFHKVKQPPENEYNYDILIIKEDRKNFPFFHNSFCKIEKKFLPVPQGYKELYYTGYFIIFSQSKKKDFGLQFYININNFIRNEKLISRKKFSIIKEQTIYPSLLLSKTSNLRKKKKGIKRIGKSLLKGRAIPRCFVESSKYYLKFSKIKKKKKKGLYRLAKFFFSGKGIGRNRNISLSILKKTGKKGNNKSFFDCASILTRGFGVQCDFNRASSLVQKIGKPKKVKRRTRRKIIKKKKKRKKMRKKKSHKKRKKKKKKILS